MSQTRLTFQFDYSEDDGATWLESTPVTFEVRDWDVKVLNELVVEHVLEEKNKIIRLWAQRVRLLIKIDVPNFYPTVDTDNANFVWLQKWMSKPLKRISHNAGIKLDGLDYWATASNTYYVETEPENEPDKHNSNLRSFEMVLTVVETL